MPINLTDPVISLLVQVPIGIAVLVVLYFDMRNTAAERKQNSVIAKQDRDQAAADRQQMLELFTRDSARVEQLSAILQGFQPFMLGLVNNVRDFSIDTTTAVKIEANRMIAAVDAVPHAIEPQARAMLAETVEQSIRNQNARTNEIKGHIDLSAGKMLERFDQASGSLSSRLDKVLGQIMLIPTVEQHRDLVTEVMAIKSAVARIEANATRPLPPLPEPTTPPVTVIDVSPNNNDAAAIEAVRQLQANVPPAVNPPFDVSGVQG